MMYQLVEIIDEKVFLEGKYIGNVFGSWYFLKRLEVGLKHGTQTHIEYGIISPESGEFVECDLPESKPYIRL